MVLVPWVCSAPLLSQGELAPTCARACRLSCFSTGPHGQTNGPTNQVGGRGGGESPTHLTPSLSPSPARPHWSPSPGTNLLLTASALQLEVQSALPKLHRITLFGGQKKLDYSCNRKMLVFRNAQNERAIEK